MLAPTDEQQLRALLDPDRRLSPAAWAAFTTPWQPLIVKRKTILTAVGETERYLYFILEGVQRAFFLGPDDRREATIMFAYAPSFGGIVDSFLTRQPSYCYLETLTACRMLRMPYEAYARLLDEHADLTRQVLDFSGHALRGILLRLAQIQCFTAEEKFRALLTRSPHLLHVVPHKYLASYLGLDATTFSKLLAAVKL